MEENIKNKNMLIDSLYETIERWKEHYWNIPPSPSRAVRRDEINKKIEWYNGMVPEHPLSLHWWAKENEPAPNEEKVYGKVILTREFKKGDIVCSKACYDANFLGFFAASQGNVDDWSGKNQQYLKIVPNETV